MKTIHMYYDDLQESNRCEYLSVVAERVQWMNELPATQTAAAGVGWCDRYKHDTFDAPPVRWPYRQWLQQAVRRHADRETDRQTETDGDGVRRVSGFTVWYCLLHCDEDYYDGRCHHDGHL